MILPETHLFDDDDDDDHDDDDDDGDGDGDGDGDDDSVGSNVACTAIWSCRFQLETIPK